MDETKLFHSPNPDLINALYNLHLSDGTYKQLEALKVLSKKLVDNTKDESLKELLALQCELEEANLHFKHKKMIKVTSLYKSIMIADAVNDADAAQECINHLAHVVNTTKDVQVKCVEDCIAALVAKNHSKPN